MKHLSLALSNIKKYQSRQRIEAVKTILYMVAEFLTLVGIFALAFAYYSIIN